MMADRRRLSLVAFIATGLVAAAALVVFVAPHADSNPDGLEKVAADTGIDGGRRPHSLGDSPFAGYGADGVEHAASGTIVAGLVGVAVTFLVCLALVALVRGRREPPAPPAGGLRAPVAAPPA